MKKFLISLCLGLSVLFSTVSADEIILNTELNPEFIQLSNLEDSGNDSYRPPLMTVTSPASLELPELPEKYDARDDGRIYYSGLGQGSDGTCWAFASVLCSETALGGKINLSEQHLRYSESNTGGNPYGYNRSPSSGGNFQMFTAYASSWRGLVTESDDPYVYGSEARDYKTVTAEKPISYHVQDTIDIPNPGEAVDLVTEDERTTHINEVKYYIYTYGCCFSSIYWSADLYNSETKAYCNNKYTNASNHAVNIIGWDDNYPAENFNTPGLSDGAFIVKNSQGTTGRYIYLSYEDLYAGWFASVVSNIEDKYNYGEVYTLEHFEPAASFTINNGMAKTTNVFTSRYDGEYVSAVGMITKSRNLDYEIYISKTADGNEESEDKYVLSASGNIKMPGYSTIKLDNKFLLGDAGTKYCVRVVFKSDDVFVIPLEYASGPITDTYAKAGESYFITGAYNYDVGEKFKANLYVKAFTDADYTLNFNIGNGVKYSLNGAEFVPCKGSITAGLNDEILFDFSDCGSNITSYFINDTEYAADTSFPVKITEDIDVSIKKQAGISTSASDEALRLDTCRKLSDSYEFELTPQFGNEHTVIAVLYKGKKAVGTKVCKASGNDSFSITANYTELPDSVKIFILDDFTTLSTEFKPIVFELDS